MYKFTIILIENDENTVGCIKTSSKFRSEINIFSNTFQGDCEL